MSDAPTAVTVAVPPRPPRAPRQTGRPGQGPPRPPRRMPRSLAPLAPLSRTQLVARSALVLAVVFIAAFVLNLVFVSHVRHAAAQTQLFAEFRAQLADGTAPVSEGDADGVLLDDGDPVAVIEIPKLGLTEVVVEGTTSSALMLGAGHRRDTVLPGQVGVSVIMGRAAAYGGPFSRIQTLAPGDEFTVITGQGEQTFEVIGVRYAGDLAPASPVAGESRLILETARGVPYVPSGVARVDAKLVGDANDAGARQTTPVSLDPAATSLAIDTSTVWALVFAVQLLIAIEVAAILVLPSVGARKVWIAMTPPVVLVGVLIADQAARLLPNLM